MKQRQFLLIISVAVFGFWSTSFAASTTTTPKSAGAANLPKEALDMAKEIGVEIPEEGSGAGATAAATSPASTSASVETTKKADLKESEIPVSMHAQKASTSSDSFLGRTLGVLAVFGILICGGWLMIRRTRGKNTGKKNAPQIKVLAQHFLGPRKSLAIVRVAGESILIGVTDSNVNMIKSLALLDEDIPNEYPGEFAPVLQQSQRRSERQNAPERKSAGATSGQGQGLAAWFQKDEQEEADDFAIKGIRDFVSSRLKNMRSIE